MRFLLGAGADIDARDAGGWPPLAGAILNGRAEAVRRLISAGADPSATSPSGNLLEVAGQTSASMTALLIRAGADPSARGPSGETPLIWSAHHARPDVVELLLNVGADVTIRGANGWTPLHAAIAGGSAECVRVLLKAGFDPEAIADEDQRPAMTLTSSSAPALRARLSTGVNLTDGDSYAWTALHWAAYLGLADCVKLLLDAGSNPSAISNKTGETPEGSLRGRATRRCARC
jgi:ankyrin repeat protein